jgi:hypothetical protein
LIGRAKSSVVLNVARFILIIRVRESRANNEPRENTPRSEGVQQQLRGNGESMGLTCEGVEKAA